MVVEVVDKGKDREISEWVVVVVILIVDPVDTLDICGNVCMLHYSK